MGFKLISYHYKKNTLYNITNICYYALWKKTQNANNSVCVQVQKCITKYYKKGEKIMKNITFQVNDHVYIVEDFHNPPVIEAVITDIKNNGDILVQPLDTTCFAQECTRDTIYTSKSEAETNAHPIQMPEKTAVSEQEAITVAESELTDEEIEHIEKQAEEYLQIREGYYDLLYDRDDYQI